MVSEQFSYDSAYSILLIFCLSTSSIPRTWPSSAERQVAASQRVGDELKIGLPRTADTLAGSAALHDVAAHLNKVFVVDIGSAMNQVLFFSFSSAVVRPR